MQQAIKKVWALSLIALLAITPLRIDFFYLSQNVAAEEALPLEDWDITENTTWNKDVNPAQYGNIYVEYGATLTIEKGTQLAFQHLYIYGNVRAIGTVEEKIKLTGIPPVFEEGGLYDPRCFMAPSGTIEFGGPGDAADDPESVFEFVEFSAMGGEYPYDTTNCPTLGMNNGIKDLLIPTAYAAPVEKTSPAIAFYSGKVRMNNCDFKNNAYADVKVEMEYADGWNAESFLHIENSNLQNNSQNTALISRVTQPDVRDTLFADCFDECKSHYPDDYSVYGEICATNCTNEVESNPSFHDQTKVVLTNNWYGDANGPKTNDQVATNGEKLTGDYALNGWSSTEFGSAIVPAIGGASNVFFLPGIKASRLYMEDGDGDEDNLWVPNLLGNDLEDLALDENGASVNDVYTRDVLDEVALPGIGGNIYKTFLGQLDELKEAGTINDYQSFAYDWRASAEDVAKSGAAYEGGIVKSAIADVQALSDSSKSKKVTIVAHSNGGLVAKAMMLELERLGMADRVDRIIFVGTPQMGTPLATLSLLYGYDESALLGTLISRSEARTLAENMPGVYGLLPSEEYFKRTQNWFISFLSEKAHNNIFTQAYGEKINSYAEFRSFLLGQADGREKPASSDVENENILNEKLLTEATAMHQRLDAWTPPTGVDVVQIAGWGLDTVGGIEYTEKEKMACQEETETGFPVCVGTGEYDPIYEPKFTVDGDKAVVATSALMLPEAGNVKRYWVDLNKNNRWLSKDREHKDILEVDSVLTFISNIITEKSNDPAPRYIQASRPSDYENSQPRLRMALYSPLDIHLYDEAGNHTGPKIVEIEGQQKTVFEENIPNSYYYQMGERKYVGFPAGEKIRVEMEGYALGAYTLKLEEVNTTADGEEIVAHAVFSDLPVTENALVKFNFSEGGLESMTPLEADMDSDGESDYVLEKNINGTAELPLTVKMISQKVNQYARLGFVTDAKTQKFLQVKLRELARIEGRIAKLDGNNNKNTKANQIRLFNKKTDDLIKFIQNKFQATVLSPAQETLIKNLESIKL